MNRLRLDGKFPFYYWFLSGILLGMLIGWMFSGFINLVFRLLLFAGVVVVVGLAIYLWTRISRSSSSSTRQDDIPEGNWRTIDPAGRK